MDHGEERTSGNHERSKGRRIEIHQPVLDLLDMRICDGGPQCLPTGNSGGVRTRAHKRPLRLDVDDGPFSKLFV